MSETQETPVAPIGGAAAPPRADNVETILKRLGPAGILGLAAVFLPVIGVAFVVTQLTVVGDWLRAHPEGVWLFIGGFAVLSGVAILPTQASAVVGGWSFGFGEGLLATLAGFTGGAIIAYLIARPTAGMRVVALIDEKPKWRAVYEALLKSGFWRTVGIVALLRLPPNSPFAMTNVVLAATRVPITPYLIGTVIGMMPRITMVVWIASHAATLDFSVGRNWVLLAATAVATIVILGVIGTIAKRAIERVAA